jgi:hypothetical protein
MYASWLGKLSEDLNGDHKLTVPEHEDTKKQKESRSVTSLKEAMKLNKE